MQTYRIGIIGFGAIGKVHAWAYSVLPFYYSPLPFKTRITAVATAHQHSARAAAEICGAGLATTDFRRLTESPDIDIIHICSPNNHHREQLASALKHNKHVYCDKPLVAGWDEAGELIPLLVAHRGRFGMAFQVRFFPTVQRAAHLLRDGRLGRILSYRLAYLHSGNADPQAPARWKLSRSAGGGVIADLASHVVDLLTALGGEIRELSAQSSIAFATRPSSDKPSRRIRIDAEDHLVALVSTSFGGDTPALGTIEATKIATGAEDELRLEIHGTKGALRINSMTPHWLEFYDATRPDVPFGGERGWTRIDVGQRFAPPAASFPGPKFAMGWVRSHLGSIAEFLYAVHEHRDHSPNAVDGLYVQQLIDALQRSAHSSRPVVPLPRREVEALLGRQEPRELRQ